MQSPRVTKPYSDHQWSIILDLGERVDKELIKNDVRLTMGGEPTFVAIDGGDAPEWNTAALGPRKLGFANTLSKQIMGSICSRWIYSSWTRQMVSR
jgi:uncharacterized protein (DUF2126 family)